MKPMADCTEKHPLETHLSIALGLKACMQGLNVRFYTVANLSNVLIKALDGHRLLKLEKLRTPPDECGHPAGRDA